MPRPAAKIAEDLLTTADAAKILGLSSDMVRLLAREGRLLPAAESVRGVRMFRREDVEALAAERAGVRAHHHIVQFYEGGAFLSGVVADFVAAGLRSHGPVLVFSTGEHEADLMARLTARGHDVRRAIDSGQLQVLDARATLDRFMRNNALDPGPFRSHLSALIEQGRTGRSRLWVYGEMVDILCRDGLFQVALQFEELWNELARECRLTRLCAYAIQNFRSGDHTRVFEQICASHTRVVPTERYVDDKDPEERLRKIALLEQRACALPVEMERRQRAEQELSALTSEGRGADLARGFVEVKSGAA